MLLRHDDAAHARGSRENRPSHWQGIEAFTWENEQGVLTLLNDATTRACTFLLTDSAEAHAPCLCSIYEFRPKGCQMYPVVLNEDDRAVLDEASTPGRL